MSGPSATDVAVVTGGASGVGRAVVRRLREVGAKVLILDIDRALGEQEARSSGAGFMRCDVAKREDWALVGKHLAKEYGAPTLLSFNAGVMTRPSSATLSDDPFGWIAKGGYDRVFDVNMHGVTYGLEVLLPMMAAGGSIVVTASVAGLTPTPFDPFYAASKHAVIGLVRSLGRPLRDRRITINCFCPGPIDTPLMPADFVSQTRDAMSPDDAALSIVSMMGRAETGTAWLRLTKGIREVRFEFPRLPGS